MGNVEGGWRHNKSIAREYKEIKDVGVAHFKGLYKDSRDGWMDGKISHRII